MNRSSDDLIFREMTADRFPRTLRSAEEALVEGVAPGVVAGFWSAEAPDFFFGFARGMRRRVPSEQPMEIDTIFDVASLSKVMGTASLAAALVDRGWLRWETRLQSVLPEFRFSDIELGHLLSHTAGFIAWKPFWEEVRKHFSAKPLYLYSVAERQAFMRELVLGVNPDAAPGEKCLYSDVSFLLLGYALEAVTQMPLDRAIRHFVWDSMGVKGAFYRRVDRSVDEARLESVAATEKCDWRGGVLQGQVHDDNCWAMGGYAGHAGVFASLREVTHFARQWLSGWVSPRTRLEAWTRVTQPAGCERTFGWDTPSAQDPSCGELFSPRSVGHLGFTGTSLWIDPDAKLAAVLLTNRVHPSRENIKIRGFRPKFHNALRSDIADLLRIGGSLS